MYPGPVPQRREAEQVPTHVSSTLVAVSPPAPPPSPPPLPSPPPSLEASRPEDPAIRLSRIRERLDEGTRPRAGWRAAAILIGSLALFLAVWSGDLIDALVIVVPVLIVHEAGHYLGMRAFGYRDISMFFIPFFGAAVSGKKDAAPAWQRGVVLLLGPIPGILVGTGMYFTLHPGEGSWEHQLMTALIVINAFNLLPFTPLDGGRLVEVLITHRRPLAGAAFRLLAVAGLGVIAYTLQAWVLGVVAGFMLLTTRAGYQTSAAAVAFRRAHPEAPSDPRDLTDAQLGELVAAVDRVIPEARSREVAPEWVRMIHCEATSPRPSGWAATLLAFGYALGWACTLAVGLVSVLATNASAAQSAYERGVDHAGQGRYTEAIAEYTKAIELFPMFPDALYGRAESRRMMKEHAGAIADYSEAIRLAPGLADAYCGRGIVRSEQREFALAVAELDEAIRLNPNEPVARSNRAWIRATCPDDRYRSGPGAVADAERANELTGWKENYHLAVAAAAYAEVGRYDDAVRWQQKVLTDMSHVERWGELERGRLTEYQQGRPLRDPGD